MTDKQIIIDSIDVSGCEFYWREKELCNNGNLTSYCQENKDCLYKKYKRKEQECERLKWCLKEIRYDELKTLDIELDEYETHCIDTEYTNIINLVEEALEERSPEDCRYGK